MPTRSGASGSSANADSNAYTRRNADWPEHRLREKRSPKHPHRGDGLIVVEALRDHGQSKIVMDPARQRYPGRGDSYGMVAIARFLRQGHRGLLNGA
jgi:hypothetical protein